MFLQRFPRLATGGKIADEGLVQAAQENSFARFRATVNRQHPVVLCDKPQTLGVIKVVTGDMKSTIPSRLESPKAVDTKFRSRDTLRNA